MLTIRPRNLINTHRRLCSQRLERFSILVAKHSAFKYATQQQRVLRAPVNIVAIILAPSSIASDAVSRITGFIYAVIVFSRDAVTSMMSTSASASASASARRILHHAALLLRYHSPPHK
jgi:hypothetical protein